MVKAVSKRRQIGAWRKAGKASGKGGWLVPDLVSFPLAKVSQTWGREVEPALNRAIAP